MFQNVFQRFIMFIFTELMYLSYARSMGNICVLYMIAYSTRSDNQSEITAENQTHVHLMQIFRYILTSSGLCAFCSPHTRTPIPSPVVLFSHFELPGTQTVFESLFLSLLAFISLFSCCVQSISMDLHVFLISW